MSEPTPNIFSIVPTNSDDADLAGAVTAVAHQVLGLDTQEGRSLFIGAAALATLSGEPSAARQAQQMRWQEVYEDLLERALPWRQRAGEDQQQAESPLWVNTADFLRQTAMCPNCEEGVQPEARDHGMCQACARDLRAAGWVPAAEVYPTDNSPALGGQKETT